MKLNKVLLGLVLSANTFLVFADNPAPVFDISNSQVKSTTSKPVLTLSEQLGQLSGKLDARNRSQVNIQRQLDDLQNEVNELRGVTELHTHQLTQILERQRELYQELDRRVSEALKPAMTSSLPLSVSVKNTEPVANYSSDLTENEAYDRAVNLVLKDQQYEQAIPEFRRFNEKYPQSTYSANAHYWLGQLLFNKGELVEAKQEFSLVVNQYKESTKRADALFKLAMVAQKQNEQEKSVALYQQLIKEYPNSTAAQLAQPRLKNLGSF